MRILKRPGTTVLLLCFILGFGISGKAHCGQNDDFYEDFLLQRMMIAKLRISRGDGAAKALLKSLKEDAKKIGMKTPAWADATESLKPARGKTSRNVIGKVRKTKSVKYEPLIQKAARTYRLPAALIKAVIHTESCFLNDAVSRV